MLTGDNLFHLIKELDTLLEKINSGEIKALNSAKGASDYRSNSQRTQRYTRFSNRET